MAVDLARRYRYRQQGQPIPRMTDSMAPSQAGPGPSSFKLAALSANSFHLDSPPFTGTAGPLSDPLSSIAEGRSEGQEQHNRSRSDGPPAARSTSVDASRVRGAGSGSGNGYRSVDTALDEAREASLPPSLQRRQHDQHDDKESSTARTQSRSHDVDVPRWSLDDKRQRQSKTDGDKVAADDADATPSFDPRQHVGHTQSTSLSPPPFSSASAGPLATSSASTAGAATRAELNAIAQARVPRKRELSRPTFTQTSHADAATLHLEDAGSSATRSDGDGNVSEDVDADLEQDGYPSDDEVDGDGHRNGYTNSAALGTPKKMPLQSQIKEEYRFPRHRLPTRMRNESKIPLVIVACGSFSPPTYLHLRIFEMAKDQVIESGKYELLGGYYSPVSDYYRKEGLAKATHRVRMCELAVEKTSTWLMVDAWESLQDEYQRTAVVLDHFDEEINGGADGGILTSDGARRRIRVMLLAGGDLIQSMGEPGVWADVDLHHILGRYGCMIVERTGADVWSFLLSHDLLWRYRRNLKIVKQTIFNDISSSKVRLFVRRGQSIKYLLPNSVIHYIEKHKLYRLPIELDTEPPDADLQHF